MLNQTKLTLNFTRKQIEKYKIHFKFTTIFIRKRKSFSHKKNNSKYIFVYFNIK